MQWESKSIISHKIIIINVIHRLKAQLNDVLEAQAPGLVVLEPRLSRIRLRLNSFEPRLRLRLRLSLLNLKSLYTKFHLNWQLFNIYLLLYKKHVRKFWTASIRNYATLKLKIAGLDSGSRFKYRLRFRLRFRLTSKVQAQGSGSRF